MNRYISAIRATSSHPVAVVTGRAQGIGRAIVDRMESEGIVVEVIDRLEGPWYVGDIAEKEVLEHFARTIVERHGQISYLIHNALPPMRGIADCTWEEFEYAQRVGVVAPYYLTKLLCPYFVDGASVVNISSTRATMSEPQTESYTAAKGGLSALTHALAVSLGPRVRVNSISPGWIETRGHSHQGADALQHPAGRVGTPADIAEMVLYLCSERATFITGQDICIDGGLSKLMRYHGDHGWSYDPHSRTAEQ